MSSKSENLSAALAPFDAKKKKRDHLPSVSSREQEEKNEHCIFSFVIDLDSLIYVIL